MNVFVSWKSKYWAFIFSRKKGGSRGKANNLIWIPSKLYNKWPIWIFSTLKNKPKQAVLRLLCLSGSGLGNAAITVQICHSIEFDSKALNRLGVGEFSMFKLATKCVVHTRMGSRSCESFLELARKLLFFAFFNLKTWVHNCPEGLEQVKTWKCPSPSRFSQ